jgi:hypothetical protein
MFVFRHGYQLAQLEKDDINSDPAGLPEDVGHDDDRIIGLEPDQALFDDPA